MGHSLQEVANCSIRLAHDLSEMLNSPPPLDREAGVRARQAETMLIPVPRQSNGSKATRPA